MSLVQRVGVSLVLVGAMLGGCDDSDDSSSDEQTQTADEDESSSGGTATARAGRSGGGGTSAARGGAGGTRSSQGAAGREESAAGGSTASAGRRSAQGGTGGSSAARAGSSAAGAAGAADAGAEPPAMTLDDGQVAQILTQVNTSEVSLGMLAMVRAVNPQVRDYAQALIASHNTAQARQAAVFDALNITLSPSSLSTVLNEAAARTVSDIEGSERSTFDLIFVRAEVEMHAQVLEAIDKQLLPNVTAQTLRDELVLTRTEVSGHLDAARSLLTSLEAGEDADAGTP